jgi:hypothetical protein
MPFPDILKLSETVSQDRSKMSENGIETEPQFVEHEHDNERCVKTGS